MKRVRQFLQHEATRLQFRMEILWRGIVTATLWTAILVLWQAGIGTVWQPLLGLLGIFALLASLPLLFFQLALIVDACSYVLYRQIRFFPWFIDLVREDAKTRSGAFRERADESPWLGFLVWLAEALSPLSGLSRWLFLVLGRAPADLHVRDLRTQHVRAAMRNQRRVEYSLVDRAWHRAHLRAA